MTTKGPISPAGTTSMSYSYSESSQVALSIIALRPGNATNQAPTGTITQPAAGTLFWGHGDQLRRDGHRSGGRDAAGERVHVAGGFPSRRAPRTRF